MGQPEGRTWDTDRERQRKADYRERKRLEALDEGQPWKGLVGEEREQAIRDHFGYASSEKRSQAERQEAEDRVKAKLTAGWKPGPQEGSDGE